MKPNDFRTPVAVSHSDPLVAIGLIAVLGQQVDIELVDLKLEPRWLDSPALVVVADYATGLQLVRQSRARSAATRAPKVLVVTACEREHEVRSALEAGVQGYLQVGCDVPELVGGVRLLARGSRCLSGIAAQRIAEGLMHTVLTLREREVLCLVARGESNKVVARELGISVGTVKAHVKAILAKLGASTRTQATRIAVGRGLVDPAVSLEVPAPTQPLLTTLHMPSHRAVAGGRTAMRMTT